ncbi:hypothetical protein [Corynebacterium sp. AOP12-C2-36]|uniref:hypothetical protein n=1 Tax=Corynebacterium sp. AOP12-C2-36 TaxID=3457723 RepID=UPI004034956F
MTDLVAIALCAFLTVWSLHNMHTTGRLARAMVKTIDRQDRINKMLADKMNRRPHD